MDLKASLHKLLELQDIEDEIEQNRKDKQNLYLDIEQQREKIQELTEEREKAKQERQRCRKEADAREIKVRTAEQENEKLQVQRNTTKNTEQFKAMGNTITSNRADIQKWEDEELELLDQADQMKKREAKLDRQLQQARQKLDEIKDRVSRRARKYDETIAQLEKQEQAVREEIAPNVLNNYERLARSRGSSALVKVKQRVCQGCHTTLPKQTENLLLRGSEIVYCHNCGRMLMLNKEDSTW